MALLNGNACSFKFIEVVDVNIPEKKSNDDWENFNHEVSVCIREKGSQTIYCFSTRVVSVSWIKNKIKSENYAFFKHCIVLKYFDENLIEKEIAGILRSCNCESSIKSLNCLGYKLCKS
jgi:hypothetical protein